MSVADELLKLKSLLESGAISEEEFDIMKKRLLENGSVTPTIQSRTNSSTNATTAESYTTSPVSRYKRRYFNDKPFKVVGWISSAITMLFAIVIMILLIEFEVGVAMALVWEFSFIPGVLGVVMGGIVKSKSYSSALLIFSIIAMICGIAISIATIVLYNEALYDSVNKYLVSING